MKPTPHDATFWRSMAQSWADNARLAAELLAEARVNGEACRLYADGHLSLEELGAPKASVEVGVCGETGQLVRLCWECYREGDTQLEESL